MAKYDEPLLIEIEGEESIIPEGVERKSLNIPNLSEREVMKHFLHLSQMNYGVDTGFYPLGSCTMKYNMKLLERVARYEKALYTHPLQHEKSVQGSMEIMYHLERLLCEITGMDAFTLQPCAGAHGEFTGMLIARAYFESIGEGETRREVIVPDSAHGTNPASARMAGFEVVEIPSKEGRVDMDALRHVLSERTAAFMLTNPNTLGIFEREILEISREVKKVGALLYYDGANLNAIMGKTKPGIMGFDIVHVNLHKTFGTPHGGGGPGSGPVGVKRHLEKFLPVPRIEKKDGEYHFNYDLPHSIGKVSEFYGNFAVLLKAYAYILKKGKELERVTERAVLNANYLMKKLREAGYNVPHPGRRMHEFVISLSDIKEKGLRAMDVAKRLLDYGFHPPTVYFPLIVDEAFMVEPTEDETRESMDAFVDAMKKIREEDVEIVKNAPHTMPVARVNEAKAVKEPILTWKDIVVE
ncbi:MAG: aminomethyl-transferring glycine dehydrogenase subunit GcvPB [Thermoplasmata archaeon]|nr:aminomethyl-transferring glycine dehydrogenase subunit GcvPB [Thermoplasmata archaeon]